MAQPSSQSIGSGNLQDEANPDPRRREDKAAQEFDRASEPDKAKRKADAPDDLGDTGRGDGAAGTDAREDDAATPRR